MTSVKALFDGRVFVPAEPVDLPTGTSVEVLVPAAVRRPTPEEDQQWREILNDLANSEPPFPTVEDALRPSRRRS